MKNLDAFKAHGDIIWNIANLLRRLDCVLESSKDAVITYQVAAVDLPLKDVTA